MKKSVALLLSLMLIMSLQPVFASGLIFTPVEDAPAATAEASLETETITLDCGLTFPAPVEWSDGPLPESFQVENQLYARYDGDGRFMQLRTNEYGKNATVEDMAKLFANEDSFTNVKVTENPLGQKLVYMEAATGNFLSLIVFDGEGTAYICTFGNFYKGNPVVEDPVFMGLVETVKQNLLLAPADDAAQPAASGDEMLLNDGVEFDVIDYEGFRFLFPKHWAMQPTTEEMRAEKIFMLLVDEEKGYSMEGRIEFPGDGSTIKDCFEAMKADTDTYGDMITGNNESGQPIIVFKHKDGLASGFAAMDSEGALYIFTFSANDDRQVALHTDLTAIIAHCATYVSPAGSDAPAAPAASGIEYEYHTVEGAFTIPAPKGWELDLKKETDLFRATDPESGVYFYVRVNTYDRPRDPEGIYQSFAKADTMKNAQLLTGKDGLQIIQADGADGTFSALMIPDEVGNVYIITFTIKGNTQIQDNETLLAVRSFIVSEFTLN